MILTFPKQQIFYSSKLKEYADDNLRFDENGRKLSKRVENTGGKGESAGYEQFLPITSNFAFSHSIIRISILQKHKSQDLFGKGLTNQLK